MNKCNIYSVYLLFGLMVKFGPSVFYLFGHLDSVYRTSSLTKYQVDTTFFVELKSSKFEVKTKKSGT